MPTTGDSHTCCPAAPSVRASRASVGWPAASPALHRPWPILARVSSDLLPAGTPAAGERHTCCLAVPLVRAHK
eukprot:11147218-Alexandrium_andersonii.AAC.1